MTHPIPLRPSENPIQQAPSPLSNIRTRATASGKAFTPYAFGPASWTRCYEIAMDYASEYGAAALYNVGDDLNVVACFKSASEIERDHPDLFAIFATKWSESKVNAERLVVVPPEQYRDVMSKDWSHIMSLSLPSTQLPHAAEVLPAIYNFAALRLRAIQRAEQDEPAVVDAGASRPSIGTMVNLDAVVTTFNGHYRYTGTNSYADLVPLVVTTLGEMLRQEPDNLTAMEVVALFEFGEVRIGGGAAGAFTVVLGKHGIDIDAAWDEAKKENEARDCKVFTDLLDARVHIANQDEMVIYADGEGASMQRLGTLFTNFFHSLYHSDGGWGDFQPGNLPALCISIAEGIDSRAGHWSGRVGIDEHVLIVRADTMKTAIGNIVKG